MAKNEAQEAPAATERAERHLRSVRLKLVTARRELQTVARQSGMARGKHGMDLQIQRAERHVQELEETEATLVKQLTGNEEPADSKTEECSEAESSQGVTP